MFACPWGSDWPKTRKEATAFREPLRADRGVQNPHVFRPTDKTFFFLSNLLIQRSVLNILQIQYHGKTVNAAARDHFKSHVQMCHCSGQAWNAAIPLRRVLLRARGWQALLPPLPPCPTSCTCLLAVPWASSEFRSGWQTLHLRFCAHL